jgi:hypothetical protein
MPEAKYSPAKIRQIVALRLSITHSPFSRLLKTPASFVLGSLKSSTYPRGYASGFDSPAALLDGLFEQPAGAIEVLLGRKGFPKVCKN